MPKKRKLNSKNPKYWPVDETEKPVVERKLIKTIKFPKNRKVPVYAVFEKDIKIVKKTGYLGDQPII